MMKIKETIGLLLLVSVFSDQLYAEEATFDQNTGLLSIPVVEVENFGYYTADLLRDSSDVNTLILNQAEAIQFITAPENPATLSLQTGILIIPVIEDGESIYRAQYTLQKGSRDFRFTFNELQYLTIDVHNHIAGKVGNILDYEDTALTAIEKMDLWNVKQMLIMPPPFKPDMSEQYTYTDLLNIVSQHQDRLAFLGGGGTINIIIQQAVEAGTTSQADRDNLEREALAILDAGGKGFGEIAIEHVARNTDHVHVQAPADHELLLLLADIAADYDVPIDIHMEALPEAVTTPGNLPIPPNPETLPANMEEFQTLLAHNSKAKIIWSHLGWDNIGYWTAELCDSLLEENSNLYFSFRVSNDTNPVNKVFDDKGVIKTEWLTLFEKYPDRFMVGSDQFFQSSLINRELPDIMEDTVTAIQSLPDDIKQAIFQDNAREIYGLE